MNAFELTYNINNNTQREITTTTLLIVNLPRVWIPKGKRSFLWYRLNSRQLKCSQTTQCYIWRGGLGAIKEQSWLLISLLTTTFHLLSPGPGLKGCQWIWRQIHFCLPSENLSVNPFPRNQELQGLPRKLNMFLQVLQRPAQNRGWRSRKAIYPLQVAACVMFPVIIIVNIFILIFITKIPIAVSAPPWKWHDLKISQEVVNNKLDSLSLLLERCEEVWWVGFSILWPVTSPDLRTL